MQSGVPISPEDISEVKAKQIPAGVIDAFNELIAKNYNEKTGVAEFSLKDVVNLAVEKLGLEISSPIFKNKWLNVEPLFTNWRVKYDRPGLYDNYQAFFTFTAKK